jgi:hypothetical protein
LIKLRKLENKLDRYDVKTDDGMDWVIPETFHLFTLPLTPPIKVVNPDLSGEGKPKKRLKVVPEK